jgi:hypothetical protein
VTPLFARLDELAADVGRLQRHSSPEFACLVDRIAAHIEALDAMFHPTAAELFPLLRAECAGDEELAVEEALRLVDARVTRLRRLLGVAEVGPLIPPAMSAQRRVA